MFCGEKVLVPLIFSPRFNFFSRGSPIFFSPEARICGGELVLDSGDICIVNRVHLMWTLWTASRRRFSQACRNSYRCPRAAVRAPSWAKEQNQCTTLLRTFLDQANQCTISVIDGMTREATSQILMHLDSLLTTTIMPDSSTNITTFKDSNLP